MLLRTLGLPSGGVVSVGHTHMKVRPAEMTGPTDLRLGAEAMLNAGVAVGQSVDVQRRVLPPAAYVVVDHLPEGVTTGANIVHALHGHPITDGDRVVISSGYLEGADDLEMTVVSVTPDGAGIVGAQTNFGTSDGAVVTPAVHPITTVARSEPEGPATLTTDQAVLVGLENEVELLTGWLSLLAGKGDLADAWGLPAVAGVLVSGPNGCGKSALAREAARRAGCRVIEVDVTLVFKAESLLDKLSGALDQATGPTVVLIDRLEAVTGDGAMTGFRNHSAAILRWFLDSVSSRPQVACVLGVSSTGQLHESVSRSPLLPRSISIPPPDLERRRLLFEAALAQVPKGELDLDRLAALSSGFSGADVMAAAVQASSVLARTGGELTTEAVTDAVRSITPSLGSVPMGEMTSHGFDKVANLDDVKRRLTEAVIWPVTQPERFQQLGIDPPKGLLLFGPPGTGKTFVVKALAHEAGAAFFSIKGAELLDKYVGESERGVREAFARARDAAPSIMFFDEFDALAPVRGRSSTSVSDSVVAALLTELDGVSDRGQVAVIAATNRADLIDPALLRSGRFETHIELGLPKPAARRAMLNLTDVPLADDVNLDALAERTEGLSFADIGGLLREAALTALRESDDASSVDWAHLEVALARFANNVGS
jgi:transitional endoplasmic reticulum ATPase